MVIEMKKHEIIYNACYGGFRLSDDAVILLRTVGVEVNAYGYTKIPRHDPRLVKVVKKLGHAASGKYSQLEIAKIDGNMYRIDEYDGFESIVEPDDIEWIFIGKKNVKS